MIEIQRDFINDTYIFHTVGLRKKRRASIQQLSRIKSLCHAAFTVYQKPSYPPWYLKYAITGVIRGKSKRSQDFFVTWRKSRGKKSYTA